MYTLHLWNKQYGNGAKFIVENDADGKFTEFTPARSKDVAWTTEDLTKNPEYKSWDDFKKEKVEDINMIVM